MDFRTLVPANQQEYTEGGHLRDVEIEHRERNFGAETLGVHLKI